MHGAGTKTAITTDRGFDAFLDVSRLISRVGFGHHTGIDRVEFAYLEWCLASDAAVFGLARVAGGFALLDRDGLSRFHSGVTGKTEWGYRDFRGVLGRKTPSLRARAESDVRRWAISFASKPIFDHPDLAGCVYLNTGHSNLRTETLRAISGQVTKTCVFLHDVIPLDFPEFQRSGSVAAFHQMVADIDEYADLVIVNSQDTQRRAARYLKSCTDYVVAHLGVEKPDQTDGQTINNRPYFITIGTIEPRKNHRLLLEIWSELEKSVPEGDMPQLHIVGRRGWKNENVFSVLDNPSRTRFISEHSNLSDREMWALLIGARALLFPSFAEGFGLPSLEAASLGVPVICGELAIHRELMGDYPVYVDLQDPYLWQKTVLEQSQVKARPSRPSPHIPSWDEHFACVNQAITSNR